MTDRDPDGLIEKHLASDPAICAGHVCVRRHDRRSPPGVPRGHAGRRRRILAYGAKLANAATKLSEDAFRKAWDNSDDTDYDRL